jgi:sterol desaturase/sphingolipid hydroxylase (fatty acid hydroxylase superfamily)
MRNLNSFLISLGTILNSINAIFSGHYWGISYSIFSTTSVMGLLMLGDLLSFDNSWKNFKVLKLNGYSALNVLTSIFFCYLLAIPGSIIMTEIFIGNGDRAVPYFSLSLCLKIAVFLIISEIGFSLGHIILHSYLPFYHRMHHCCIHPSYITNFIFHPFDLMLEFGTPILMILSANSILFNDNFAALCAVATLIAWYASDHDVFLQLKHNTMHHRHISSYYHAYLGLKGNFIQDNVRKLVRRIGKD